MRKISLPPPSPTKPYEPRKPERASLTHKVIDETVTLYFSNYNNLQEILNAIPKSISHEDVIVDYDYEGVPEFCYEIFHTEPKSQSEIEKDEKEYQKKLKAYEKRFKEYQEKLKKYEEEMLVYKVKYKEWEEKVEVENRLAAIKQIENLKKKYNL